MVRFRIRHLVTRKGSTRHVEGAATKARSFGKGFWVAMLILAAAVTVFAVSVRDWSSTQGRLDALNDADAELSSCSPP